jgi:LmbE family N-acetylglucosaminyl deacetylase
MKILVVAAHPDDEVLGCGATIARLHEEGHRIRIAILGEGITSRYADRRLVEPHLIDDLQNCSRKAIKLLGVDEVAYFELPDNRFDTLPLLELTKRVEGLIEEFQPELIFTQHPGDLNLDHALTARAVLTASRPVAGQCVKEIYTFEAPSSTEWAFRKTGDPFAANVFYDISAHLDQKLAAMEQYDSEARPFPHPRSPEALRARAQLWGTVAGCPAAEAFELIRSLR